MVHVLALQLIKYFKTDEALHSVGVVAVLVNAIVGLRFPEFYWIVRWRRPRKPIQPRGWSRKGDRCGLIG